jgi:hypothetical protein
MLLPILTMCDGLIVAGLISYLLLLQHEGGPPIAADRFDKLAVWSPAGSALLIAGGLSICTLPALLYRYPTVVVIAEAIYLVVALAYEVVVLGVRRHNLARLSGAELPELRWACRAGRNPKELEARIRLSKYAAQRGNFPLAASWIESATRTCPEDKRAWLAAFDFYIQARDIGSASDAAAILNQICEADQDTARRDMQLSKLKTQLARSAS